MAVIAGPKVRCKEWLKTGERMLARTASRRGWHRYCCLVIDIGGGGGVGWGGKYILLTITFFSSCTEMPIQMRKQIRDGTI